MGRGGYNVKVMIKKSERRNEESNRCVMKEEEMERWTWVVEVMKSQRLGCVHM